MPLPPLKTLHVRVAEARGLMARDFAGRSDPFVVLDLTGRFVLYLASSNPAYARTPDVYVVRLPQACCWSMGCPCNKFCPWPAMRNTIGIPSLGFKYDTCLLRE